MIDTIPAEKFKVPVLYLDNHLLIVEKPPNLPVQKDSSGDEDLLSILKNYIGEKFEKPGAVYLGMVHRLDRPVGGVMVFARTSKAAARLSKAFSAHTVEKLYLAVARGEFSEPMELTHTLKKDEKSGMVSVAPEGAPGGKAARLRTEPIAIREDLTLARVTLYTGRPHQIRVQHAAIGHPIWGDARYGDGRPGQQIALWAHALAFEHPTKRETVRFASAPPANGAWTVFDDIIENWR